MIMIYVVNKTANVWLVMTINNREQLPINIYQPLLIIINPY